ncbi:30S ribosomal protein S17 [Candidatus Phytoplasma prunorum]|uniref:30S ribosomal protein S17 n=1 Tax=Candidatus Phytoplasma prunorum TaxID=47565 RepID=UPI002FF1E435
MLRNSRKIFIGNVVSDKMNKTVTAVVNIYKKDLLFGKIVKKSRKFYVHDEMEKAKKGNLISFMETRPLSKTKKFRLIKIISNNDKDKKQ